MNGHLDSTAGYFDPQAEALSLGERLGRLKGQQAAQEDYEAGRVAGRAEGWNEATARANGEMLQQLEFTRQHVQEKEALALQLQEQGELIQQLHDRLIQMEHAAQEAAGLQDAVTDLRQANQRLQDELATMTERFQQRTREYHDQLGRFNQQMVVMNAARSVLETLASGDEFPAAHVRTLFGQQYRDNVTGALSRGTIQVAPDQDELFARLMPKTHRFIKSMLAGDADREPVSAVAEADDRGLDL